MNLPPLQQAEEPYNALEDMRGTLALWRERYEMYGPSPYNNELESCVLEQWIEWVEEELQARYETGYREGFTDGYAYFPDLGHGKVAGE